jgi:hypothetical protein
MGNRLYLLVVALLVVLCGIGYAIFFMIKGISALPGELQRVVIPGESAFTIDQPDEYTIFYEYKSFMNGKVYATGMNLGAFEVKITDPNGSDVPLNPSTVSNEYDAGSYSGYAVYTFDAQATGEYTISGSIEGAGDDPTQTSSQRAVLAIGKDFMGKIFGLVFGTLGLVFGSLLVGGTIVVVMLIGLVKSVSKPQSG